MLKQPKDTLKFNENPKIQAPFEFFLSISLHRDEAYIHTACWGCDKTKSFISDRVHYNI